MFAALQDRSALAQDFSVGFFMVAVIAAFTLGEFGHSGSQTNIQFLSQLALTRVRTQPGLCVLPWASPGHIS